MNLFTSLPASGRGVFICLGKRYDSAFLRQNPRKNIGIILIKKIIEL